MLPADLQQALIPGGGLGVAIGHPVRHLMLIEPDYQGVGRGGRVLRQATQLAGELVVEAHVVPLHQGAGIDRCQPEQHHLAAAHGVLVAPDGEVDARQDGEAGQQKGESSHDGISLPRIFNNWRAPSSRAPDPSSSQDLVIRVSPRS
ncbi:hypothetical protein D3C76_1392630 [compost metagenome]